MKLLNINRLLLKNKIYGFLIILFIIAIKLIGDDWRALFYSVRELKRSESRGKIYMKDNLNPLAKQKIHYLFQLMLNII